MWIPIIGSRKATAAIALGAMVLLQGLSMVPAARAVTPAIQDADLSSEARAVDAFVTDLTRLDTRAAELAKKASLTRAEIESLESLATGLKRRLPEVQNAIGAVIRKLKAADQWNNLNATLLAKARDSQFQAFVRSEDFKKLLEESASTLAANAGQIDSRLVPLRAKAARARAPRFEPGSLRFGLVVAIKGGPTQRATDGVGCFCFDNPGNCVNL